MPTALQSHGKQTTEWMPLAQAVEWIRQHHPEQTPERFGCKSWPDVLSKARVFPHEIRAGPQGRPESWFRQVG